MHRYGGTVRLRGALLWEADGEPRRDDMLVSDERKHRSDAPVVILDHRGRRRAASPAELPAGSVLLLPPDASDGDLDRIQHAGYQARRAPEGIGSPDVPGREDLGDADLRDEVAPGGALRRAAIADADAELDDVSERLRRELRQRQSELFDARGWLRRGAYARMLREGTGGRLTLNREEMLGLTGGQVAPRDNSASPDAP